MLTVAEELLLLALDDDGRVMARPVALLLPGLAAALLAGLADIDKVEVRESEVILLDTVPAGDALLDETLQALRRAPRPRRPRDLVGILSGIPDLQGRVLNGPIEQRLVAREQHNTLVVFHSQRYPVIDSGSRDALHRCVHAALSSGHVPPGRLRRLIGLISMCGLEASVSLPAERKTLRQRAQAVALQDPVSDAVRPSCRSILARASCVEASAADGVSLG